jgi:hypothetical protein
MDEVIEAILGFAQVNGRLPCPAQPDDAGIEDINGGGCNSYAGFVPVNTLGLDGRFNEDSLLTDPWGNPYRYYVTFNNDTTSDFTAPGQMRAVGLVDLNPADGYIDLDGRYLICRAASADDTCDGNPPVFGNPDGGGHYAGAPFVLLSMGKNWSDTTAGDELENSGNITVTSANGNDYLLKDVANGETNFVRRPGGLADDFDDVVRWVSPGMLFARMIAADQLP